MTRGKISFARGIHFCPKFLFLFHDQRLYVVNTHTHTHTHTADCVEIVYELPLLQNNTVRFPMVSLEFFSDIILPVPLWPWSRLSL